jgi:hypothetical protein
MNPTDIPKLVEESFHKHRDRLVQFFQEHGFDEAQATELTETMRSAVFFLDKHALDRTDIEIEMRKELKKPLKKGIEDVKTAKRKNTEFFPAFDWDKLFEPILHQLENHKFIGTRAGKNKSLEIALESLFWRLKKLGKGQTEQVNIVYDLFVEFDFDDYGKENHTIDTLIGEKEQKERIRIHFQQKAMKEREQYAEQFGW